MSRAIRAIRVVLAAAAVAAAALPAMLSAQSTNLVGVRVRLLTVGRPYEQNAEIIGTIARTSADSIFVAPRADSPTVAVARTAILTVSVSRGTESRMDRLRRMAPAMIPAVALVGFTVSRLHGDRGEAGIVLIGLAAPLTLILAPGHERWERVDLSLIRS